jgi:membrane associated rhomboid family serine protease
VSETERDSGWSEQYAATGGWPPPAEGQRRYGPGPAPDQQSAADPARPAPDRTAGSTQGQPGTSGYAGQPTEDAGSTTGQWGQTGTSGYAGQPTEDAGSTTGQWGQTGTGGYDRVDQWGQPAEGAGPHDTSGYGQSTQWGPPAEQGGSGPEASTAWAPGDPAYGRLAPGTRPQQQRPQRPWEGRRAPVRRQGGTPVVTYTLIAICVVVYLMQQANPSFTARYGLIPIAVEQGQYARLITSAFLHAGLLHLATNMITLYIVGTPLERVLRPARYLLVYVLSALGGSLFSVWLSPEFSIGVGASGAIFGLFGALLVLRRQVGAEAGGLAVLIGLNLVISFAVPNISWQAHIGGLVTGVLVALVLRGVDRLSRRPAS